MERLPNGAQTISDGGRWRSLERASADCCRSNKRKRDTPRLLIGPRLRRKNYCLLPIFSKVSSLLLSPPTPLAFGLLSADTPSSAIEAPEIMATSLQQQLAAIAEKSTHQLDLKAQRSQHSQSLLFHPQEAASQTFDTIFQTCLDGFEELCLLDSRFIPFAKNLFSEQSKHEDRTQMTANENQELDKVIGSFLGLVSGRLQLRPAQHAVEWLVRRFRIQENNIEPFILAFLPFHDTSIFPTVLSLLPKAKQLPPSLKFLQPYISSLAAVPRHAILYSTINNPSLFTSINNFVLTTAKQRNQTATLLGFWASILAQAINGLLENTQSGRPEIRRQREEEVLLRILPVLQTAFDIRDVPELYLGCCMVVVILATKVDLEDKVLDGLMDAVAGNWSSQTIGDGIAALSVMAQEKATLKLPRSTVHRLLASPNILPRLEEASVKYPVDRLFTGLVLAFIKGRRSKGTFDYNALLTSYCTSRYISEASKLVVLTTLCLAIQSSTDTTTDTDFDTLRIAATATANLLEVQGLLSKVIQSESIEVKELESRLNTPLRLELVERKEEVDGDGDANMGIAESVSSPGPDVASLDNVKSDLRDRKSFLDGHSNDAYSTVIRVFAGVVGSEAHMKRFTDHICFKRTDGEENALLLTFLARTWISHSIQSVRQSALRMAKTILTEPIFAGVDPQSLFPYILLGLTDISQPVRRAASELLLQVHSAFRSAEKAKKLQDMAVLSKAEIYGSDSRHVRWMKSADVSNVVSEAIVENLEEYILDANTLPSSVANIIDGDDDDIELKTSTRTSLYNFLVSHAISTPLLDARLRLLRILSPVEKTGTAGRKQILLPAIKTWIALPDLERMHACNAHGVSLIDLDRAYVGSVTSESEDEFDLLRSILTGSFECGKQIRELALERFKKLWADAHVRQQTTFAQELLTAALSSESNLAAPSFTEDSLALIKQVKLSGDTLITLLQDLHNLASMPDGAPATKRRRTSSSKTRGQDIKPEDLDKVIRRLTLVLELVESSRPERHSELLKHLFHALGDIQHLRSHLGSDLVYLQQITISSLLTMVNDLKSTPATKMDRSALRADLVVDCMRSSSSSQIHNSALLLISSMASWAPDLVLHSVMPIFTFMSNTILRQGDDHSAHVIDQTVSHVIPPLVASLRKKNQDLITGAAELLLSFIAAFEHMPMHRRLQLFKQLVEALDPKEALSAVIAMLFERYPSDRRVPGFCAELSVQFDPAVQLKAIIQYIDLVMDALQPKRTVSEAIFIFEDTSPEAIRGSAATLLASLVGLLKEDVFVQGIRSALRRDDGDAELVRQAAGSLIDRSIGLSKAVVEDAILNSTSERVVSAVFNLPPLVDFVRATAPLLDDPEESLGSRVLESLELRATEAKTSDNQSRQVLLDVIPTIGRIIEKSDSDRLVLYSISCLDKVVEKFGKKNISVVLSSAKVVSAEAILGHANISIQITALFFLSTAVETLRDDMVGILPQVLQKALKCLQKSLNITSGERLYSAVLALMTAVVDFMPWLVSSTTITAILQSSIDASANANVAGPSRNSRTAFVTLAAKNVDIQHMLKAIAASIDRAFASSVEGTEDLTSVLSTVVNTASKPAINRHSSLVLSIMKHLFDLRGRVATSSTGNSPIEQALDELDRSRDAVMMTAIMKMNDATFRPFFVQLVEWATEASDKAKSSAGRSISLYGFLSTFFSTLKSLVTSYATYVLDFSHDQLLALNTSKAEQSELARRILNALSENFQHDQDDFWQAPAHFKKISGALVHQLKESRNIGKEDHIGILPAITELATAASSPDHLKELNQELLACMRSKKTHVRLAAVKCERTLTEKLGEDWLALLPEMLPFISELQEDEDEEVEKETLAWIKGIEAILGDSLEGMLQ